MIHKEYYATRQDGTNLYRNYSDNGVQIRKVGTDEIYDEAIDVDGAPFTYEETDVPIEMPTEEEATESDYITALREMGVDV